MRQRDLQRVCRWRLGVRGALDHGLPRSAGPDGRVWVAGMGGWVGGWARWVDTAELALKVTQGREAL